MQALIAKCICETFFVISVFMLVAVATSEAKDNYVPFVESLQTTQLRAAADAAPKGQDDPIVIGISAEVPSSLAVEPEESQYEALADEKAGPLTLEETQNDQVLDNDLSLFGYDVFSNVRTSSEPVAGIPVPPSYRIGPGDSLIVQLYGKRNLEYTLSVTREGDILVPEYGPIKVAGLTFDEVEVLLSEGFERRVIGTRAVVTMGELRTIQIRLAGDVMQPGIYTIGGLSTLIDALLTTGGVRSSGSLRNIQLMRNGKRIVTLDLYDLLLRGKSGGDQYLAHNDTIFVPPIGPIVYVGGEVQRPAIYELRGEQKLGQILDMAGGLLPTASLADSHIERIRKGGFRTLVDFAEIGGDDEIRATAVRNGDFLRILPLEDQLHDVVLLTGQVERPGGYQFRTGMRITDLIPSAEALLPGADMDFVLIRREDPATLRTEVLYSNLMAALSQPGGSADHLLQARDELMVFSLAQSRQQALADVVADMKLQATDYRPARLVETRGAVRFPGVLPLQESARLLDVLAMNGGELVGADQFYGVIARTQYPSRRIQIVPFSIAAARTQPQGEDNPTLSHGDRVYVFDEQATREKVLAEELQRLREQASFVEQERLVTVLGEVRYDGVYPLVEQMRASDLLCAADGLSRKAYGVTAELSRITHTMEGESSVEHIPLDSVVLLQICDLARRVALGEGSPAEYVAVYADDLQNPQLQRMDQLSFSEKMGWVEQATVTLSGEVMRPGVYAIDRGETLCEVLDRAGGVSEEAYIFGAVFTRNSIRDMQQQTIDELHAQLDDLMVELSLSHSFNNREKSSHEWAGKQDYLRAIQQLQKAEANGRMVIDLENVMTCKSRYDLVLEDGDGLHIPVEPDYVQVAGQVYVPTSHLYRGDRKIRDYIELSGGHTILGQIKHAYVIQANGEVLNVKGSRTSSRIARKTVSPGARIYVPLNVDRMNGTEKAQTWVQTLVNSAILAGLVL